MTDGALASQFLARVEENLETRDWADYLAELDASGLRPTARRERYPYGPAN